jgi:hypothetical protein
MDYLNLFFILFRKYTIVSKFSKSNHQPSLSMIFAEETVVRHGGLASRPEG